MIIITGPTAVGKTSVSIELAKKLNGEIISADSMQIYRGMDIGTAKIKREEMEGIPHHMIDIIDPKESFSVAEYKEMSEPLIKDIINSGKTPILVGGTGFYINSFLYDRDYNEVEKDIEYRKELEKLSEINGQDYLYNLLIDIDPESKNLITPSDSKRIIRALEIYKHSGVKLSFLRKNLYNPRKDLKLKLFFLFMDRQVLYNRINMRVDEMIKDGLVDEVKTLYESGLDESFQSMQGIGYKEIIPFLRGEKKLDIQIELIKKKSRNYAKRQFTWFRREKRAKWLDVSKYNINDLIYIIERAKYD